MIDSGISESRPGRSSPGGTLRLQPGSRRAEEERSVTARASGRAWSNRRDRTGWSRNGAAGPAGPQGRQRAANRASTGPRGHAPAPRAVRLGQPASAEDPRGPAGVISGPAGPQGRLGLPGRTGPAGTGVSGYQIVTGAADPNYGGRLRRVRDREPARSARSPIGVRCHAGKRDGGGGLRHPVPADCGRGWLGHDDLQRRRWAEHGDVLRGLRPTSAWLGGQEAGAAGPPRHRPALPFTATPVVFFPWWTREARMSASDRGRLRRHAHAASRWRTTQAPMPPIVSEAAP